MIHFTFELNFQVIYLGTDRGASTHGFVGNLHQDRTRHWRRPPANLSHFMTFWHDTIAVFGDADVVFRAVVKS